MSGMLQLMIDRGITGENVAAFSQLCALKERAEDRQSEREFAAAFAKLQSEMPRIDATKPVPNKDGSIRYKFAPYEEIMNQVRAPLQANGFAIAFDQKLESPRIIAICTLMHVGGHSRSNTFAARIGSGPPGSSEAQQDGAASTYAKRFALCNALNIVIEHEAIDDDARAGGGEKITREQADELRDMCDDTKSNRKLFLDFAGVPTGGDFEDIFVQRFDELVDMLNRKRAK